MNKLYLLDVREFTDELYNSSFSLLNEENKAKVLSYKNKEDQLLCMGARLLERKFVSGEIAKTELGKPVSSNVYFSISHKFPYAIIYINNKSEVGVDLELEKELSESVISSCFSIEELSKKSPIELWTIKEAYLKMIGTGINKKMKDVSIDFINKNTMHVDKDVLYKTLHFDNYIVSMVSLNKISVKHINKIKLHKLL